MSARDVIAALGGKWRGSYGTARCPVHDDHRPSLSIRDGDDDVIAKCHAGCDWRDIKAALRDQGLLPDWRGSPVNVLVNPEQIAKREAGRRAEELSRIKYAQEIWRTAIDASGTLVETYLRSRAITASPPQSLRFIPYLKHAHTGLELPAMVAAVRSPEGEITGIHRTFLRADGQTKAPVTGNKMMLGKCGGGAVRFAKAGTRLGVGEGIETCLSVAQACPDLTVWACLSTSGLKAVILPEYVHEVVILADADEPGEKAAQETARRFVRDGKVAKIARPSIGKDWNDTLQAPANVVPLRREARHVG